MADCNILSQSSQMLKEMLKTYHLAWLRAHPDRTEKWLEAMLKDGFDVHHLDGDWHNEATDNLVLIEAADHMMLHSGARFMRRGFPKIAKADRSKYTYPGTKGMAPDRSFLSEKTRARYKRLGLI